MQNRNVSFFCSALSLLMFVECAYPAAKAIATASGSDARREAPLAVLAAHDEGAGVRRRPAIASASGAVAGTGAPKTVEPRQCYMSPGIHSDVRLLCPSRHTTMSVFLKPFEACTHCGIRFASDTSENTLRLINLIENDTIDDRIHENYITFMACLVGPSAANIFTRYVSGATLLMRCMEKNKNVFAAELLRAGVDYKATDVIGANALHYAVRAKNKVGLRQLLSMPRIAIDAVDIGGHTPLRLAWFLRPQDSEIIDMLVDAGARETGTFLCCCCAYVPTSLCCELCMKNASDNSCCLASSVLSGLVGLFCGLKFS